VEPPDEILIVVDHNPSLARRLERELVGVRVLENEEDRGLSGARNTGLRHAAFDVIAFLDDDAFASRDWLRGLKATYESDPAVIAVGGSVEPSWQGPRPRWFPAEFGWVIGCSYEGQPTTRAVVRNLLGCNMSVRRSANTPLPTFSPAVGRVGRRPVGCEETEFFIQLKRAEPQKLIVYEPEITVTHVVEQRRMTLRYFVHRCWCEGLSKAIVARSVGFGEGLSTERQYVRRTLTRSVGRAFRGDLGPGAPGRFARAGVICLGFVATTAGYVVGSATAGTKRPMRQFVPRRTASRSHR
jgi:glycosyltransferase involved in cell wall biosynthesis